jgi:hypothetical protein
MSTPSYWVAVAQPGNIISSSANTSITFTTLTGNTSYIVTVFGIYSNNTSTGPTNSAAITTSPAAPASASITSFTTTGASLSFVTTSNGTAYSILYNLAGGGSASAVSSSPLTVTNLVANTSYTLGVYSTANSVNSTIRYASQFVTLPPAPTIGTATATAYNTASVSFTGNTGGGGAAISYNAISSPGGFTGSGGSSPITVTGLSGSTTYTFNVFAATIAGVGPSSPASNSITTPVAPASYTVVTGTKSLLGTAGSSTRFSGNSIDDDVHLISGLPFNVKMYGVSTNTIGIGSNFYIGFGTNTNAPYSGLSLGSSPNPSGHPYLHVGSNDQQYNSVYYIAGTNYFRVRLEGGTLGSGGTPAIYEITFFKQVNVSDDIYIEFVTASSYNVSGGNFGMTNGVSPAIWTGFGGLAANSSYVIILDSNGGYKSITSNRYINPSYS